MSKKLISFDWAIKRLLRNDNSTKLIKANFVVLEGFGVIKNSSKLLIPF